MKIGIDLRLLAAGKHTGVEEYTLGLLRKLFELDRENEYVLFFNAWRNIEPDFGWAERFPRVTVERFRFPNKLLNHPAGKFIVVNNNTIHAINGFTGK